VRVADLADRFAAYAARKLPGARGVRVSGLARIPGGASRETYRLVLHYEQDGSAHERRLILRRDPPGSLIDTERRLEFGAYAAFFRTPVPVPEAIWLEEDPAHLDYAFCVMQELPGLEASPAALLAPPYAQHREKLGAQKWRILGEIAKADPRALGLVGLMRDVAPGECWRRELDYWEGVLDEDELEPQPIMRAVIRRLRRGPPPPAQKISVVHGDYRTGNFLADANGEIHAILDWEMAHLGDPLEDLAWGINPLWTNGTPELAGGLLPKLEAVRRWERSSGLVAEPAALLWWELFSCVKGQGIWVSSAREYQTGKNQDPILAMAGLLTASQDRCALHLLGRLA
jgi:aminoglycoside phosphotransferase (APT) family kinase protein